MIASTTPITQSAIHPIDIGILAIYFIGIVLTGIMLSRRASQNIDSYFLGGRSIPWYLLGISNASGQFDITGTMWMVMLLFVYGLKSLLIPWLWPTFNQVFLMVFLAAWLRRSNVLTGAEWLKTRFTKGVGLELAHLSVVLFALVSVVSFLAYAFVGIGKFAQIFLPWDLEPSTYALLIMGVTTVYVILGGMYSVVVTDILQFGLLAIASVGVATIAMLQTSPEAIAVAVPDGWGSLVPSWNMTLDWTGRIDSLNAKIGEDAYALFGPFLMMALLKGILASIAGPLPNSDLQRVLAARSAREASLMSGIVSPVLYIPRYFLISGIAVLALVHYSGQLQSQGPDADFEQILPYVIRTFVPTGLMGVLLAGLFAAFMSTFDSTVNAGAAYLVNDVYRRYINPHASHRRQIAMSYGCSMGVVLVGVAVGFCSQSINDLLLWITAGLYGGYVAPNLLKWIWWRLNGIGYAAGMIAGVVVSLLMPGLFPDLEILFAFPYILISSGVAAVVASLATQADVDNTLKAFYRQVRPWGCWGPVHQSVEADTPGFRRNTNFWHDMLNCLVGIAWQIALSAMPVFLVLRDFKNLGIALAVAIATSLMLKFNWYNRLPREKTGGTRSR